jgi:hypothetical protein
MGIYYSPFWRGRGRMNSCWLSYMLWLSLVLGVWSHDGTDQCQRCYHLSPHHNVRDAITCLLTTMSEMLSPVSSPQCQRWYHLSPHHNVRDTITGLITTIVSESTVFYLTGSNDSWIISRPLPLTYYRDCESVLYCHTRPCHRGTYVAGFPSQQPRFKPRTGDVGFVVGNVAEGQFFPNTWVSFANSHSIGCFTLIIVTLTHQSADKL